MLKNIMKKIYNIYKKNEKICNYLFFGFLTFVLTLGIKYIFLLIVFDTNDSLQLQLAIILSWIIAVIIAYVTNRKYVFKSNNTQIFKEFVKFIGTRVFTLLFEMCAMYIFVSLLKLNSDKFVTIITAIVQLCVIVLNYLLSEFLIFKNDTKKKFNKLKFKKIFITICTIITLCLLGIILYVTCIKEQKVPVLTFHGVVEKVENKGGVDISISYFEKIMKYLNKHNYKTLTMDEFYKWKKGELEIPLKSVLITFDDGWKNTYENALPIMEKYNINSTVFVVGYFIQEGKQYYMDLSDLKDIDENHPLIKYYSHSYDMHYKEASLKNDYNFYSNDMKTMNKLFSDLKYYAYPFGDYNNNYSKALKNNGYLLAFNFGPYAFASKSDNDYSIPRYGVFESTDFNKLKFKLMVNF